MTLDKRFPSVSTMERASSRRVPRFVHDYLVGGIGHERCVSRNREALDQVLLMPRYLNDAQTPRIETKVLGQAFDAPFGVAPMGLSGLMWPNLELILGRAAREHNIPYVLSTFACVSPERLKPAAGRNGWFQYYPSLKPDVEQDILDRCQAAEYETLVLTVDIPVETRRERDIQNGLSVPPRFDLRTLWQMMLRPAWSLTMLRAGVPKFETLLTYAPPGFHIHAATAFISQYMKGHITAERFRAIRDYWKGSLVVKGILSVEEAQIYTDLGADGIIVSNHGGRQLDAAPTAVEVLPAIRHSLGEEALIMADGGIRSGVDIARMLALGADFVFIGRPFVWGVSSIGEQGGGHVIQVLKAELEMTLAQIGCSDVENLREFLYQ